MRKLGGERGGQPGAKSVKQRKMRHHFFNRAVIVSGSGEPVPGIFIKLDPDIVFLGERFSFFYKVG